jgi:hypothetical protein
METGGPPADLGFETTLDRTLVHRRAVSEVFVTDLRPRSETDVTAAAQLPLNHGYFSDHTAYPPVFDTLLVLEAGRQAAIAGTHAHLGARPGTQMIVDRFSIETDPEALLCGDRPGELVIDNRFTIVRRKRDRVRAGRVDQVFYRDGARAGSHTMDVLFLTPGEYEAVRRAQLDGTVPDTAGRLPGVQRLRSEGVTVRTARFSTPDTPEELTRDDRLMTALPLFHINAPAYSVLGSLARGAGLILLPRFSASGFLDAARRHGATEFNAIGAMLEILMRQPERENDADNPLRLCYTGPSPTEERHLEIERRFGFRIVCGYALSESPYGLIWKRGTRPFGT